MKSPRLRLVGVLLALTGVSCIGLIALGWRSLNRFELEIARVLRQACVNTAEETARQIQRDFKSPVFNLLEQVDHTAIKNFQLDTIAHTLRKEVRHFEVIDTYFLWSLTPQGESERPFLLYVPPSADTPESARAFDPVRALGFFVDPELAQVLRRQGEEFARLRKNFAFTDLTYKARTYHVVYHFLWNEMDQRLLWGFEGFLADPEHLGETYFPGAVARWNRGGKNSSDFPAVSFSVINEAGVEVSRSGRSLLHQYEAEARFPFVFFDTDLFASLSPFQPEVRYWTVRTGYEPGDIDSIVRGEGRQQRWAWLLVGLVAVVGTVLTATGMARELRLSRMKSDFVASVSHDLKTPLAKIQLFADTLESGRARSPEKAHAYLRVISVQSRKLGHLIGELLDFSRIESGIKQYPLEEIDLRAVLQASVETFDHELSRDGYIVQISLPSGELPMMGCGEALEQVFDNLISNAIKYSPQEKYLRVTLATVAKHAVVEVKDKGIGIPRREHRKIFQKFYRTPDALALAATGSGIGLSIVDHVVRAHGGRISVASMPGHGSTFRVELPLTSEGPS